MPRFAFAFCLLSLLACAIVAAEIPLSFEENRGQAPAAVLFAAHGQNGSVAVTRSEIEVGGLYIRFAGAAQPRIHGAAPMTGRANSFLGRDPSRWQTNIPTFGAVEYERLYPGIDLVLHGNGAKLQYDFSIAPEADPKTIRIAFKGARGAIRIDDSGDLVVPLGRGELRNRRPFAFQESGGVRVPVEARYEIRRRNEVGFHVGSYDSARPLIIDPVLSYASYFGGTSDEEENAVAVDNDGNVYFAGSTKSSDIATTAGAAQTTFGGKGSYGGDVFVVKYDPKANKVVYTTYLGGTADDNAFGIAVDSAGSAYVVGQTDSKGNFPLSHPFQPAFGGNSYDAFITKLSPAGDALVYSSFLGGNGNEQGNGVAVDAAGNAYITGYTFSSNFPSTNGFQTTFGGRIFDAFLTKINAAGSAILYSTYIGGNTYEVGNAVAVDANNNAYVTGYTFSLNFPTKAALQGSIASGTCGSGSNSSNCADAFVAKIDTSASGAASLVYSTFLGGSKNDYGNAIGVTSSGEVIVAGATDSTNFPTVNAKQSANGGGSYDAWVAKLNAQGSALVYSTYLGGSGYDEVNALRIDSGGRAVVAGTTASSDFPTKSPFQATFGDGKGNALVIKYIAAPAGGATFALISLKSDAFVAKYDGNGAQSYASFLGGSGDEIGYGVALDSVGNTWVTGSTTSTNLQTVTPVQSALKGGIDLFFARIAGFGITGVTPSSGPTAGGTHVTLAGEGFQSGATVTFGDAAATGVGVTSTSISATTPPHAAGAVNVAVTNPGNDISILANGFLYTDAPLPSLSLSPASRQIEVGWNGTFTVLLSNAQQFDVVVTLSASAPSLLKVPASVTVPAGATSATFAAAGLSAGAPVTITAKLPQILGGQTAAASATVIAARFTPALSVPGQARLAGAGGSFFKSSFWIVNPSSSETKVRLKYVTTNTGLWSDARELTIAPNDAVSYADVLSEAFSATSDTGGVIIVEVAPGSPVPLVASRTFNDSPNGTYGQYIPAIPLPTGSGGLAQQYLYGLGGDAANRSNVGVVNLGTADLDATITVLTPAGVKAGNDVAVHVAAQGAAQVNGVNLAAGAGNLSVFDVRINGTGQYFAYASKLDNKTSDPIFIPSTLQGRVAQFIDGVGAVPGALNTFFRSDLLLHNTHSSNSTTANVQFIRRGESTPVASASVALNGGESKLFHDVLNDLFSLSNGVGSLYITSSTALVAWARTYNDMGSNGTYGQFIPAFDTPELIGPKGAILLGLSDNAAFRTNAGFINRSAIGVEIAVSAWSGATKLAEKNYLVPANQTLSPGRIFLDMGLSNVSNVYLLVKPAAYPTIYAWASSIDNRSSDQTFVRPMAVP